MAFIDKDGKTGKERKHEYDVRYHKEHPRDRRAYSAKYFAEHHDIRVETQRNARHKVEMMSDFLIRSAKSGGCVDCGEKDPIVLDFDHVSGIKKTEVSVLRRYGSLTRLLNEIAKCEVRCANCHRRMTAKRGYRKTA